MDQITLLILLSACMLVGSFLVGMIPMAIKLSETKSRLLALLGSGILVGTALAIIIPEGVNSLVTTALNGSSLNNSYTAEDAGHINNVQIPYGAIGPSLVTGFLLMLLIDQFSIYLAKGGSDNTNLEINRHEYMMANQDDDDIDINADEVDMVSTAAITRTNETRKVRHNTVHQRIDLRGDSAIDMNYSPLENTNRKLKPKVTPTLGLVIHAAADGIALGAAATTSHREVELIIFLAIMLHKGPAAFSLVVFLIHIGLKHSVIRKHLLAFSLSAPIAALITYFGLSQSSKEALRQTNATGIAMLFSAGTFLYVATVHVLPELLQNKVLTKIELTCLVIGSILPIILSSLL